MRLLTILFFLAYANIFTAQSAWTVVQNGEQNIIETNNPIALPNSVTWYDLDIQAVKNSLKHSPSLSKQNVRSGVTLDIPNLAGEYTTYEVYESSIMEPGLQRSLPHFKTYKGFSTTDHGTMRMAITPRGMTITVLSASGLTQIDPIQTKSRTQYAMYRLSDMFHTKRTHSFSCGTKGHDHDYLDAQDYLENNPIPEYKSGPLAGDAVNMLEYRCAIACTGEFGARFGNTKEEVFDIILNSANQMNVIFENDFAIRLVLVEESLDIVFLDPETDPYSQAVSGGQLLGVNTGILNNAIGPTAYDIGHVYTNGCNDTGGIASLSSSCNGGRKGAGVTCFSSNNIPFNTLRIAAHEFGHQFGANHTFNNCQGNENFGTAYEPGGGTTIMSYAGICANNLNIQSGPNEYFHNISLNEVFNYTRDGGGSNCGNNLSTNNTNPEATVDMDNGFFIPMMTPFKLSGTAVDAEDDVLTYNWEQFNLGPQSVLGDPLDNAPSFRSVPPSSDPDRYCPALGDVLNGISRDSEVIPDRSRKLNFRFTVRDNNPEAGGVDYEELRFESTDAAGPFRIQYPNLPDTLVVGERITVEWDVANTDVGRVNCQSVDILLSSDGGFTYDSILAEEVPNDGEQDVIVPNRPGLRTRVMVRSVGNIFYDVSRFNIRIDEPSAPGYFVESTRISDPICLPETITYEISTTAFQGFGETLSFDVISGLPSDAIVSFEPSTITAGETTTMTIDMMSTVDAGEFELNLETTSSNGIVNNIDVPFEIIYNDYSELAQMNPSADESGVGGLPTFSWTNTLAAEEYRIQVASNPSFSAESTIIDVSGLTSNEYIADILLENNTVYYWRVSGSNRCGGSDFTAIQAFHTVSLSCEEDSSIDTPANISASGTRTVEARIDIESSGAVKDVNIKKVKGTHEQVSDLRFTLISPSRTEALLLDRACGNLANFDFGIDDEAPGDLDCPITGSITFRPVEPLSIFFDEEKMGTWTLRIDDLSPGFGGALTNFELEICADQAVNNPFIVTNEVLEVPTGRRDQIRNQQLLVGDDDNTPEELSFVLVSLPGHGMLSSNDMPLQLGDTFTQADINNNIIKYEHDDSDNLDDSFLFIVEDTKGGWIGITQFNISVGSDFDSSIGALEDELGLEVYPNPADDILSIVMDRELDATVELIDVQGRRVIQQTISSASLSEINTASFPEGIYLLKITANNLEGTKRIVIQH